ncbi:MAG: hypothetical protein HY556_08455 [Euryarchaeota archaeon]|nr:hypothetical protein [Euryarchaeota archaeon]
MQAFHHFTIRTFCHATESMASVRTALSALAGDEEPSVTTMEGHHGNPIVQLEVRLEHTAQVRPFWTRLLSDEAVREKLAAEVERRLDDSLNFYVRFDKQTAFAGRLVLGDGDDTIQCRGKVKVYPAHREDAERLLKAALAGD